jgi:hypothetical protein
VVEGNFFKNMIKRLNSEAKLPTGDTIRNSIFKSFENEQKKIKNELQKTSGRISFTLDGWTSKNQISFLGISAHWISKDWELKNVILDFKKLDGPHSGENIANVFFNTIKEYNIAIKVNLFYLFYLLFILFILLFFYFFILFILLFYLFYYFIYFIILFILLFIYFIILFIFNLSLFNLLL